MQTQIMLKVIAAVSLTWALIELAIHPEKQDKLRKELSSLGNDPSYDQLMNELPYLDAVLREILRVHPPVEMNNREVRLASRRSHRF